MDDFTWVLLTDGYYIKLFYYSGDPKKLHAYRDGDFEHSSVITYNLITRHKKTTTDNSIKDLKSDIETPGYVLEMVCDFLIKHYDNKSFSSLAIVAPQPVMNIIEQIFPETLLGVIQTRITGDYLNLPQDELEHLLINNTSTTN